MTPFIAETLADWVHGLSYDDIPDEIVAHAKEAIRDSLANAVLGSTRGARTAPYLKLVAADDGQASIAGYAPTVRADDAALVNGAYIQSCELDDVSPGAGGHPGAVSVATALAVCEQHGLGGRDLILGVVVGYDVMHRSISAVFPWTDRRGFQGTSLAGPFGAAAIGGKLLGFDAGQITNALGICGAYAGGVIEYDQTGGEIKRIYPGIAARAGLEAVKLAGDGMTGPPSVYEGDRGVFHAFADQRDDALATKGLGSDWRVAGRRMKRFPTVGTIQGAIQAMEQLVPEPLAADAVDRITITVPQTSVKHGGAVTEPRDMTSAQFSFAFSMALRVLFGSNRLELYEDASLREDPIVLSVCRKVEIVEDTSLDPAAEPGGAILELRLADGEIRKYTQRSPTGAPDNPFTPEEMRARYYEITNGCLEAEQQDRLTEAIDRLDELTGVEEIGTVLRSARKAA